MGVLCMGLDFTFMLYGSRMWGEFCVSCWFPGESSLVVDAYYGCILIFMLL